MIEEWLLERAVETFWKQGALPLKSSIRKKGMVGDKVEFVANCIEVPHDLMPGKDIFELQALADQLDNRLKGVRLD